MDNENLLVINWFMITAVIVTYNSEKDIQRCLKGLFDQEIDVNCVVVDNASTDGTTEIVRDAFPGVHLICNEENVGFAKGVNAAVQKVQGNKGQGPKGEGEYKMENRKYKRVQDYVLLLNPDAEMEEGALRKMLETMGAHPDAAIVQPLMTLMNQPGKVNTSGNRYRGFGLVTINDYGKDATAITEDRQIEYASGACMLIRRDVFEELEGMDERFFLYFEDTDFSQRVRNEGHEIWLSAKARVRHDFSFPFQIGKAWSFLMSWGKFIKGS